MEHACRTDRDESPVDLGTRRVLRRCYTEELEDQSMPTAKKRINITVDDDVYKALERLSGKRNQSVAGVGLSLIEEALDYQEDLYFSRVADERLAKKERRVGYEQAWD